MMDLNHILLFVACVAPFILLAQSWRRGGLDRGWRLAAFAVLTVTAVAWIREPETAGFFGGGAWLVLLLLPAIGLKKAGEFASQQRYTSARRLLQLLRFVHPAAGLRRQAELLRAIESAQRGDFAATLARLGEIGNAGTTVGRQAIAQSYRIRGDWTGLLQWLGQEGSQRADLAVFPLYLRALGEKGARAELVQEFVANAGALSSSLPYLPNYRACLMIALAFMGRVRVLSQLFQTDLSEFGSDTQNFWLGTAELSAGDVEAGRTRLEKLQATARDALVRAETMRRLEEPLNLMRAPLSPALERLLRQVVIRHDRTPIRLFGTRNAWTTPVVVILILLNLAMFVAEITLGGSTNSYTLYRLGAVDAFSILAGGEYWRLAASLFLHYGSLHLIFNMYALTVIGPGLEQAIGAIRFAICYLVSGLGSSTGALTLYFFGFGRTDPLVGASGCVMGLVGVWAGLFLRHRDAPNASRRLKNILVIVVIQTAFDLSTPQVSMAAHMSGFLTGVVLGLIISPKALPE